MTELGPEPEQNPTDAVVSTGIEKKKSTPADEPRGAGWGRHPRPAVSGKAGKGGLARFNPQGS